MVVFAQSDHLTSEANSDGEITSSGDRLGPVSDLADGRHIVVVHDGTPTSPVPIVACAQIPPLQAALALPKTGEPRGEQWLLALAGVVCALVGAELRRVGSARAPAR
jgi:hypothetical protein